MDALTCVFHQIYYKWCEHC